MQYTDNSISANDQIFISFLIKSSLTGSFSFSAAQGILTYGPFTLTAGVWTRIFGKAVNGLGISLSNNMHIWPNDNHGAVIQLARMVCLLNPLPIQSSILSREHRFNPRTNNDPIIVTKSSDFTVGAAENWIINNKAGSTCTVTLPDPTITLSRKIVINNYQAQTVVSASANVVPLAGGAAGTAILAATAGKWAALLSNGTNWAIIQGN